jgi:hypothetical protein
MTMAAYFDESGTHENSPVMCVAGYLFSAEQAQHLHREWGETLGNFKLSHFHAVDCAHGVREFKNLDKKQRVELTTKLIGIIKRRMELGIAVSISDTDFGRVAAPKWERGGPYLLAALQVLSGVVAWADKYSYSGEIAYFFEAGHKHQSQTNKAIKMVKARDSTSDYLHYLSHTFAGKRDVLPLQAADLLAYEWAKELRRRNMPPVRRAMRTSLDSLLEQPHMTQHFSAHDLYLASTQGHAALGERMRHFYHVE